MGYFKDPRVIVLARFARWISAILVLAAGFVIMVKTLTIEPAEGAAFLVGWCISALGALMIPHIVTHLEDLDRHDD